MVLVREISDDRGVFVHIYDLSKLSETTFTTPDSFSFQVGFAVNNDAKVYQPHIHSNVERTLRGTAEFIFILDGQMDVVFLDDDAKARAEISLTRQMAFLQLRGGHAIRTQPETRFFELKQGPYLGHNVDKYSVDYPATEQSPK